MKLGTAGKLFALNGLGQTALLFLLIQVGTITSSKEIGIYSLGVLIGILFQVLGTVITLNE